MFLYVESKIDKLEKQSRVVVTRGWKVGEMGRYGQRVQISSYKINKFGNLMYSRVIIANNTCIIYLNVAKGVENC